MSRSAKTSWIEILYSFTKPMNIASRSAKTSWIEIVMPVVKLPKKNVEVCEDLVD